MVLENHCVMLLYKKGVLYTKFLVLVWCPYLHNTIALVGQLSKCLKTNDISTNLTHGHHGEYEDEAQQQ